MYCVITSGKYETGTNEQQKDYQFIFGEENTNEKFNLYFHWYNIIHELGHVLVEISNIDIHPADEEQFVNDFAVAYWKEVDKQGHLQQVQTIVESGLKRLQKPIPDDSYFLDYFRENWGTVEMTVPMYAFFQLSCVSHAFSSQKDLVTLLNDLNYENITLPTDINHTYTISPECAEDVLHNCVTYLERLGIKLPPSRLVLMDNPDIQCCQVKE